MSDSTTPMTIGENTGPGIVGIADTTTSKEANVDLGKAGPSFKAPPGLLFRAISPLPHPLPTRQPAPFPTLSPTQKGIALPPESMPSEEDDELELPPVDSIHFSRLQSQLPKRESPSQGSTSVSALPKQSGAKTPIRKAVEVISLISEPSSSPSPHIKPLPLSQKKRKRRVTEISPVKPPKVLRSEPQKSEGHWYLDGSVILVVESVKFRLHRSVLSKHSSYFHQIFFNEQDLSDGPSEYRIIEPNVHASNFSRLLDVMEDPFQYFEEPEFDVVASVLEVSHALSFPNLYQWASRHFEKLWPQSLEAVTPTRLPYATSSVILARKCELPHLSKRPLYELVRRSGFGEGESNDESLSSQDLRALTRVREQLSAAWTGRITVPPYNEKLCSDESCASRNLAAHYEMTHQSGIVEEYSFDPICGIQALMDADWKGKGYCDVCIASKLDAWRKTRERLWKDLDDWMKL